MDFILHISIVLNDLNNLATISVMQDHSKIKRCIFEWSKESKKRFLVVFWSLVCWIDLILHIVIVLNVFNIRQCYQVMKDHSNIMEMHFWMIHRAKNEVFGHFLELALLDRLDIAYCERTKCFPRFGNVTRSWRIIQTSRKCLIEWSKGPKMRFLAIFRSLVCWIDLILHILIVLNVFQLSATLPGHEGSFKDRKKA